MAFRSGETGNVNGRPNGSRNRRTQEVIKQIVEAGHQDPLITLAELQANSQDENVRAMSANMLAPYLHSKNAAKPVPPDPQYIQEIINLQEPKSIAQATQNIAKLTSMKAQGLIDFATADSLIADQKIILYALLDENKLIAAQGGSPEQTIYIEGGLPHLPGTEIIMPPTRMNGADAIEPEPTSGEASPGDPSPEAPPTTEVR